MGQLNNKSGAKKAVKKPAKKAAENKSGDN